MISKINTEKHEIFFLILQALALRFIYDEQVAFSPFIQVRNSPLVIHMFITTIIIISFYCIGTILCPMRIRTMKKVPKE